MTLWHLVAALAVCVAILYRNSLASFLYHALAPKPLKQWAESLASSDHVTRIASAVATGVSDRLIKILGKQIAGRFEAERRNFHPELRAEVARLTEELNTLTEGWIDIPVCVWGMKAYEGDKFYYVAIVQYSLKYKKMRAHPDPKMRSIEKLGDGTGHPMHRVSEHFPFGAPHYHKVEGDSKKIVMLGETYSL